MLKQLYYTSYYSLLSTLRVKQAVFFTFFFPIAVFMIFGNITGENGAYTQFLLTGLLGITVASNGLMGIGAVIKDQYANGMYKYIHKMPFNIILYFAGMAISRMVMFTFLLFALTLIASLLFNYNLPIENYPFILLGMLAGVLIFSFIGLCLSFIGLSNKNQDRSILNIAYFATIFTSNSIFNMGSLNKGFEWLGNVLPMNPLLQLMRREYLSPMLLVWLVLPVVAFYYLFRNKKIKR